MILLTPVRRWRRALLAAAGLGALGIEGCSTNMVAGDRQPHDDSDARGPDGMFACAGSVPIGLASDGSESGFEQCANGVVHRTSVRQCGSSLVPVTANEAGGDDAPSVEASTGRDGAATGEAGAGGAAAVRATCVTNADCTARPLGHCVSYSVRFADPIVRCEYGCLSDADCGPAFICRCGERVGECVPAGCRTDADCGGLPCRELRTYPPCGGPATTVFRCEAACELGVNGVSSDDCAADERCDRGTCTSNVICGRPFLVQDTNRRAPATGEGGWAATLGSEPDVGALSPMVRRILGEHWTALGLMEHASVAAFARFLLQLLQIGAPSALVRQTQAALGDEIAHAGLCFGLARTYLARDVGPGPLLVDDALGPVPMTEIVRLAFLEACLGETCAALEAAESMHRTTDPAVAAVLRRIHEDESRHAALGFRFVAWALDTMDDAARSKLLHELALAARQALRTSATGVAAPRDDALAAHGLLPGDVSRAVRTAAIEQAVLPCLGALAMRKASRRASELTEKVVSSVRKGTAEAWFDGGQ